MFCLQTVQCQGPSPLEDLTQTEATTPSEVLDVTADVNHLFYFYVRVAINCILLNNTDIFIFLINYHL